jgi:hypothetical protein
VKAVSRQSRDRAAERAAIAAAAERLLAGTPLHSSTGKLTQSELIRESQLRRDIVYEYADLVDSFKAGVKAQHVVPAAVQNVMDERDQLAAQLADVRAQLARERSTTAALHCLAVELSLELGQARQELADAAKVTQLPVHRSRSLT